MFTESTLSKILRYGLYAMLFIPILIFREYLSPFHFGKAVVFRSVIDLLFLVYILLVSMNKTKYAPPRNSLFWIATGFVAVYGITSFTGIDVGSSVWGSLERMGGFYSLVHLWLFYVMMTGLFKTKKEWLDILRISITISLLSAAYGLLQKTSIEWIIGSGGRNKIFGTIGNPALFAGYQMLNLFFGLMLYFIEDKSKEWKYFYGISFIVNAIVIVLSGVRGSVMGMFIAFSLFMLAYSFAWGSRRVRSYSLATIGMGIALLLLLVTFRNTDFVKNDQYLARFSDLSLDSYTVQTRTWTWMSGLKGWADSPKSILVGYGPENFDIPFSHYFDPRHFQTVNSETLFDRAHNMFIEVLVTSGIIGEIIYLTMFGVLAYGLGVLALRGRKMKNAQGREQFVIGAGLLANLIAYLIHNFFIFDTTANYIVFFTILGFAGMYIYDSSEKEVIKSSPRKIGAFGYASAIIVFFVAIYSIYNYNILPAEANYATTRGIVADWNNDEKTAIEQFQKAMNYDVSIRFEIINRFAEYIINRGSGGKIDDDMKQALLLAVEKEKINIATRPEEYVSFLYASRALILLGKDDPKSPYNDEALKYSTAALKISPTFVRTYFEIAQAYLNKKDYASAVKYFEQAVALNPKATVSQWYLGSVYIEWGKTDQGLTILKQAIKNGYGPTENEYLRLIGVFAAKQDFVEVVSMYEGLVTVAPENAQYWASLAASYARVQKVDQAVEAARQAVKIDPNFRPDAEAFAKALGRSL